MCRRIVGGDGEGGGERGRDFRSANAARPMFTVWWRNIFDRDKQVLFVAVFYFSQTPPFRNLDLVAGLFARIHKTYSKTVVSLPFDRQPLWSKVLNRIGVMAIIMEPYTM